MYGIYANIGGVLMVNVTIYSIHGSYGYVYTTYNMLIYCKNYAFHQQAPTLRQSHVAIQNPPMSSMFFLIEFIPGLVNVYTANWKITMFFNR